MTSHTSSNERVSAMQNIAGSIKELRHQREYFAGNEWENNPFSNPLEKAWRDYADRQSLVPKLAEQRDSEKRDAIDSFVNNVDFGILPPTETLTLISKALRSYLNANGDLSLDEAFFGRRHKKNTSYAMAFGGHFQLLKKLSFVIDIHKRKNQKISQLKAAEFLLQELHEDFDTDPESLLRSWRRWRHASTKWAD